MKAPSNLVPYRPKRVFHGEIEQRLKISEILEAAKRADQEKSFKMVLSAGSRCYAFAGLGDQLRLTRLCFQMLLLQSLALASMGESLKELLASQQIPLSSFAQSELAQRVQGLAREKNGQVLFVYQRLNEQSILGRINAFRYDRATGQLVRAEIALSDDDVCQGASQGIQWIGESTLLSTSLSPSAQCILVLDQSMKLREVLYGFGPVEVAPGFVVLIENMIHFAPVHPERLQLAELATGKTWELYPAKGDPLRAQLAAENKKEMPSADTCARMNDPCNPKEFDEDIRAFGTDGKGRFAFIAFQSASHAIKEGEPPETFGSQRVLYIYRGREGDWRFCEERLQDSQVEGLAGLLRGDFNSVARRCEPSMPVVPDMSTSIYNPSSK